MLYISKFLKTVFILVVAKLAQTMIEWLREKIMGKLILVFIAIVVTVLGGGYLNRTHCLNDDGPREAVRGYITAMKDENFENAYRFVTVTMTDGLPVAAWAEQQRRIFKMAKIVINKVDVRRGYRQLENIFMCASTAQVTNVLHASDFLNNQGSSEFEVYTLIMGGGGWKIDSQETLFDDASISRWFPDDKTPVFKDTLDAPVKK